MTTCPGCGGEKSRRAELCSDCRRRANQLGASVITHVAAPAVPVVPRTPKQNQVYHGRLREIAQIEHPKAAGGELWEAERTLKKWALEQAAVMVGRPVASSTELNELEMERLLDFLADVIGELRDGRRRPRARA